MLSSVDVNVRKAGYTTAELLDKLMRNEGTPAPLTRIAPNQIVVRESSNFLNFNDPEVAFALRYIREHACDPINTADVLKVINMSNSTAYRKFMKALGHSSYGGLFYRVAGLLELILARAQEIDPADVALILVDA